MTTTYDMGKTVEVLGLLVAIIGVFVAIWATFRRPAPVIIDPDTLKKLPEEFAKAEPHCVSAAFFQHGYQAALELTNLGKTGVTVASVIVVLSGRKDSPTELYQLPERLPLIPQERRLVYVRPYLVRYFEAHPSLFQKGQGSKILKFHMKFVFEAANKTFHTDSYALVARIGEYGLTDIAPER